eukprot:TRINITY_DN65532_c0_g1_i1.p3 TRINITY_DN65532_c0_g1~~TRINITY_DN65532_c0_g1_i1.p3  ORF type:complete len:112 (+),score=9.07 TRINITY_DN65532_c0_g1_i1:410-745(+)
MRRRKLHVTLTTATLQRSKKSRAESPVLQVLVARRFDSLYAPAWTLVKDQSITSTCGATYMANPVPSPSWFTLRSAELEERGRSTLRNHARKHWHGKSATHTRCDSFHTDA